MSGLSVLSFRTIAASILVLASAGACKKDNAAAMDSTAAANAAAAPKDSSAVAAGATTPAGAMTPPAGTNAPWTDATTVGYAETANAGEVALGKMAESKGKAAAVKEYGRMMVKDHGAMLADTKALAAKKSMTADTTNVDVQNLGSHGQTESTELGGKAAGADWDKSYMDKAVADHEDVLNHLQSAQQTATDPDLKTALGGAITKVQAHLTKAQDVRAKLM